MLVTILSGRPESVSHTCTTKSSSRADGNDSPRALPAPNTAQDIRMKQIVLKSGLCNWNLNHHFIAAKNSQVHSTELTGFSRFQTTFVV